MSRSVHHRVSMLSRSRGPARGRRFISPHLTGRCKGDEQPYREPTAFTFLICFFFPFLFFLLNSCFFFLDEIWLGKMCLCMSCIVSSTIIDITLTLLPNDNRAPDSRVVMRMYTTYQAADIISWRFTFPFFFIFNTHTVTTTVAFSSVHSCLQQTGESATAVIVILTVCGQLRAEYKPLVVYNEVGFDSPSEAADEACRLQADCSFGSACADGTMLAIDRTDIHLHIHYPAFPTLPLTHAKNQRDAEIDY
ncbi:hypothetical protein QBC36DRAFT_321671 [Triangularia setosa]|uniref:Uncharacterized protein n=1 Tax=Triangularia setosa TaxID=2587417 RepID=A0AAN6WD09_9PEZI|nr:hypothetical protein QBC36DRAFT_321671 [Podospora setosa]